MEKDLIIGLVTFVLIETSWNVKLKNHTRQEHWRAVLIETSWNVKEKECSQYQFSEEVLIETSWNVKFWKGRRN